MFSTILVAANDFIGRIGVKIELGTLSPDLDIDWNYR